MVEKKVSANPKGSMVGMFPRAYSVARNEANGQGDDSDSMIVEKIIHGISSKIRVSVTMEGRK